MQFFGASRVGTYRHQTPPEVVPLVLKSLEGFGLLAPPSLWDGREASGSESSRGGRAICEECGA
jgi:hypothetical protein